jgi:hypothetical protein
MEKKSKKKPGSAKAKKQAKTPAGRNADAEQLPTKPQAIGCYDYTDGTVTLTNFLQPKVCKDLNVLYPQGASLLDASGASATVANGQKVFLLSDFVCFPLVRSLAEPINFLATARSSSAVYVTAQHALINNGTDVQFTVFSWNAKGAPAPGVTFDWRCRVVSVAIIG